jgi:hypothetical protein
MLTKRRRVTLKSAVCGVRKTEIIE